ncbi:MAG TPA: hypothetical protein VGQ83_40340 [Polyangia bacterium]|jgi:hypothetical protein
MRDRPLLLACTLLLLAAGPAWATDVTVDVVISGDLVIAALTGACDPTRWPTDPNLAGCNYKWTKGAVQAGAQSQQIGGSLIIRGGKGQGSGCGFAGECWSNDYCEDGVCCASDCPGACWYCQAGSGTCGARPAGFECRSAAGACDAAEVCNGTAHECPADGFKGAGVVCRAEAAGGCDQAETCTGTSSACPADVVKPAGTLCRAVAGVCDVAETCNGSSGLCPPDGFRPAGTLCDDGNGNTYHDRCTGVSAACQGTTKTCPANTACVTYTASADGTADCVPSYAAAGTACNDGLSCTTGEKCDGRGACVAQ